MTFYRKHLPYCFIISKQFVKILETQGEIDENSLKNDAKNLRKEQVKSILLRKFYFQFKNQPIAKIIL